jgi:2-iminobutanoate/2-iminopropanoate deaminase
MSDERRAIATDGAPAAAGPYSQAIAAGGFLFCAGQLALLPGGGDLLSEPAPVQARQALENLAAVCEAAGTSLAKATKVTVYLSDISTWSAVNEVYVDFFPDPPPARVALEVAALPVGAAVEVDAIVLL